MWVQVPPSAQPSKDSLKSEFLFCPSYRCTTPSLNMQGPGSNYQIYPAYLRKAGGGVVV